MNSFALDGSPYGYPSQAYALLSRHKALEDEVLALEERQRRTLRRSRRQVIMKQVKQLENLVQQLQVPDRNCTTSNPEPSPSCPTLQVPPGDPSSPILWMFAKMLQQNEELHSIIRTQQYYHDSHPQPREAASTPPPASKVDAVRPADDAPLIPSEDKLNAPPSRPSVLNTSLAHDLAPMQQARQGSPWSLLDIRLPDIEWTEDDETLLEKLLNEEVDDTSVLPLPGAPADTQMIESTDSDLSGLLEKKKQQQSERQESRRKLAQLFDPSVISKSSGIRRPRWRIEQDAANGGIRPFSDDNDAGGCELPMLPRQIFRSAVVAVMAVVELQHLVHEKKLRLRDKSLQDLEPMLNVYFDATRAWLGKLVKIPLLSILQDPGLDIDVSIKSGLFHASKGLSKWWGGRGSPGSASIAPESNGKWSNLEQGRLVKLKVRVKGIVDAVIKAIDKGDVPSGILEFWKRLTSDGVYFPSMYAFFAEERHILDLDPLGATRGMHSFCSSLPGRSYSRFEVVLVNFVLLRILVPRVVMRPWEVGLGGANAPRGVGNNLKNVASLLYLIIGRLSPLPPFATAESGPLIRLGVRRRSVEVAPLPSNQSDPVDGVTNRKSDANGDLEEDKRFLSLGEIQSQLIPVKYLPVSQLDPFIDEQQCRIQEALNTLQARLHPVTNEQEPPTNGDPATG